MTHPLEDGLLKLSALALEVAAMRLDASVSATQYSDKLHELMRAAVEAGMIAGASREPPPTADETTEPASEPNAQDRETTGNGTDGGKGPAPPGAGPLSFRPPRKPPAARPGKAAPHSKLSYDDKVRIRQQYDEAKGDQQRAPRGLVAALAARYGVSDATIYAVVKRTDGT